MEVQENAPRYVLRQEVLLESGLCSRMKSVRDGQQNKNVTAGVKVVGCIFIHLVINDVGSM